MMKNSASFCSPKREVSRVLFGVNIILLATNQRVTLIRLSLRGAEEEEEEKEKEEKEKEKKEKEEKEKDIINRKKEKG